MRMLMVAGGVLASYGTIVLMVGIREPEWVLGGLVALAGVGASGWGMWRFRRWALQLSWALAVAALAVGCYWAHFAWTFWLFTEPTLWDRVRAVALNPLIVLWLGAPLAWLAYFTRSRIASWFVGR
jgi:hypothetical protein